VDLVKSIANEARQVAHVFHCDAGYEQHGQATISELTMNLRWFDLDALLTS
jgi:hypothetical protein